MVMRRSDPTHSRIPQFLVRGAVCGAMFCLLALLAQIPAASAAIASAPGPMTCDTFPVEHAPNRPAFSLNHTEGPFETQLVATARGWHPGAQVALHLDGYDPRNGKLVVLAPTVAQGTVASDGTVSLGGFSPLIFSCDDAQTGKTLFPANWNGGTGYFVLTASDGETSVPVRFTYRPSPAVTVTQHGTAVSHVQVGTSMTVSGSGWEQNAAITVALHSNSDNEAALPHDTPVQTIADAHGDFTVTYPLSDQLPWGAEGASVVVSGTGPRFGAIREFGGLTLTPATMPTWHIDHTTVTPGMRFTISGEHWYPGATYTVRYCLAHLEGGVWTVGPNCVKESSQVFGDITADAHGKIRKQFQVLATQPTGAIVVVITQTDWTHIENLPAITVRVIDHFPTWDDIHPRVAAVRNHVVAALPFAIPGLLALGALTFFGIRRRRARDLSPNPLP